MAATVNVKIIGDATSLNAALTASETRLGAFSARVGELGKSMTAFGKKMTTNVTLPIVAGLGLAAKAAADEDREMAILAQTLRNTVGATDEQVAATERLITAMQNATGIADSDLREAMGKLTIAGRSVEQVQLDLAVAADIAAARHLDLSTVTDAMAKAAMGNTTALSRMGIQVKDASGKALTFDEILQNAAKTMGGTAAKAAQTTAGKLAILKAKLADVAENIGRILIPVVTKLAEWLGRLAEWFQNLSPTWQKVILIALAFLAAIGPIVAVLGSLLTAIQFVTLALAALFSPVGLIIAAIALLAAGAIYAYTHFQGFRDVVDAVARFLVGVFKGAVEGAKVVIDALRVAFGAASEWLKAFWHDTLEPTANFFRDVFAAAVGVAKVEVDFFRTAIALAGAGLRNVKDNIIDPLIERIEALIDVIRRVRDALGTLGGGPLSIIAGEIGLGGPASILGGSGGGSSAPPSGGGGMDWERSTARYGPTVIINAPLTNQRALGRQVDQVLRDYDRTRPRR